MERVAVQQSRGYQMRFAFRRFIHTAEKNREHACRGVRPNSVQGLSGSAESLRPSGHCRENLDLPFLPSGRMMMLLESVHRRWGRSPAGTKVLEC